MTATTTKVASANLRRNCKGRGFGCRASLLSSHLFGIIRTLWSRYSYSVSTSPLARHTQEDGRERLAREAVGDPAHIPATNPDPLCFEWVTLPTDTASALDGIFRSSKVSQFGKCQISPPISSLWRLHP